MKIENWDDVNELLRVSAKNMIAIEAIEGEAELAMAEIKARRDELAKPHQEVIERNRLAIQAFCIERKPEFLKKRSRKMTFGKIAWKVSERVESSSEPETIAALEKLGGHEDCVAVKKTLVKEALKKLPSALLAKIHCRLVATDNIRIEPDIERVRENTVH